MRKGEIERHTNRERERERDSQRERHTQRERKRERDTDTKREIESERKILEGEVSGTNNICERCGRNSEYDGEAKKEDSSYEWLLEDCHAYHGIVNSVD